jgi:radical S-adenosyl methionine domain-containing protein 2
MEFPKRAIVRPRTNADLEARLGLEQMRFFWQQRETNRDVGVTFVAESNAVMSGSYAMLDPAGRFFDNTTGAHRYSRPVLQVGVEDAFRDVAFDAGKFEARGGAYAW